MAITYAWLQREVSQLESKHLKVEIQWELDENDQEYLARLQEDIQDVQVEIERILYFGTMMQIDPNLQDDDSIVIPPDTVVSPQTLFEISSDLELFKKQNILLDLSHDIIDEEESETFAAMISKYDEWGMPLLMRFIEENQLISKISSKGGIKFIISQVVCWVDFYVALENTLKQYEIDLLDPETQQKIEYPQEIIHFVDELSKLLLSKIWFSSGNVHHWSATLN